MTAIPSPSDRIRVLLTGTEGWAIEHVAGRLRAAGHEVLRCHDDDVGSFPCRGLAGAPCPADGRTDVAVTVRAHPLPQPVRAEIAVTCALHHDLPLVVAGATVLNPFAGFTAVECRELDDVVGACEEAAATASQHGVPRRTTTEVPVREPTCRR